MSRFTEQYQLDSQSEYIKSLPNKELLDRTIYIAELLGASKHDLKSNVVELTEDLLMYQNELEKRLTTTKIGWSRYI